MTREFHWILLCAALAFGEAIGFALAPWAACWPVAAGLAVLTVLLGYGYSLRLWPYIAVILTGVALALETAGTRQRTLDEILEINAGSPVSAVFTIGNDLRLSNSANGRRAASFNGTLSHIRVRVRISLTASAPAPQPGETWSCTGYLARTGEGPFGRRRDFWVGGKGSSAVRLSPSPTHGLAALRRAFSQRLGLGLDHNTTAADLNRAMLLGERERIPSELKDVFISAGTIHIFAISGLHVLLIARLFAFFLRLTRLSARLTGVFLVPLVWAYVLLVGCGPSAVRSATMVSVASAAPLFWHRPNGFTAWAIAFLITYICDPSMLLDVGCGLSFAVMFALVTWSWWQRPFNLPDWSKTLGFSLLAWAAGAPIAAHAFGRLTPGGLLISFAILHLATISVHAAAFALLASGLSTVIAGHLNNLAALSTDLMSSLSSLVGRIPGASQSVVPWSLPTCLAWYASWSLALLLLRQALLNRRKHP